MAPTSSRRPYDIVIFGATGYTGRLIVKYIIQHGPADVKWAIAGRNKANLEKLAEGSSAIAGVLVGDSSDAASLDAICQSCKIVISVAGPYTTHGPPVVEACLRAGTHYMDLTGELAYLRWLVEKHQVAHDAGVALVSGCGFDSIPSDLGNLLIHDFATAQGDDGVVLVHSYFKMKGGDTPSGGTAASLGIGQSSMQSADRHPLSINPPTHRTGIMAPTRKLMGYNQNLKSYAAPFLMATGNERVVRRSNCLNGYPAASYGEQCMGGFLECINHTVMYWAVTLALSIAAVRAVLLWFMPAPGDGPSDVVKADDNFATTFLGFTNRAQSAQPKYKALVSYQGNVYDATAVLVVEAAVVLLKKEKVEGGARTPASCMGMDLVKQLRTKGFTFDVKKV